MKNNENSVGIEFLKIGFISNTLIVLVGTYLEVMISDYKFSYFLQTNKFISIAYYISIIFIIIGSVNLILKAIRSKKESN